MKRQRAGKATAHRSDRRPPAAGFHTPRGWWWWGCGGGAGAGGKKGVGLGGCHANGFAGAAATRCRRAAAATADESDGLPPPLLPSPTLVPPADERWGVAPPPSANCRGGAARGAAPPSPAAGYGFCPPRRRRGRGRALGRRRRRAAALPGRPSRSSASDSSPPPRPILPVPPAPPMPGGEGVSRFAASPAPTPGWTSCRRARWGRRAADAADAITTDVAHPPSRLARPLSCCKRWRLRASPVWTTSRTPALERPTKRVRRRPAYRRGQRAAARCTADLRHSYIHCAPGPAGTAQCAVPAAFTASPAAMASVNVLPVSVSSYRSPIHREKMFSSPGSSFIDACCQRA